MPKSFVGRFAARHTSVIVFITIALCLGGVYAARHMPSAVFPQTDFPRVIILVNNGVMPADEMMARITRPIEEAMKEIPGSQTIRSSTGRGTAEIDVFFTWNVDMRRSELDVRSRLAQVHDVVPASASAEVYRMTFSAFPIAGFSLTDVRAGAKPQAAESTAGWELAQYEIKPNLLRIPGVARVEIVGGQTPEYQVVVDPAKLAALKLNIGDVADALQANNLIIATGMHQERYTLSLTTVDGRSRGVSDLQRMTLRLPGGHVIPLEEVATVERGAEPTLSRVTADGADAVLLNIFSQPDASTLEIASALKHQLAELKKTLPPAMKLSMFYDQSLLVKQSLSGVWEAIAFGLLLSVVILYLFLRDLRITLVAASVIPVTVLVTILAMKLCGQSFNLMTLGGIAAAIGLVIDDAIVVVEAIHTRLSEALEAPDEAVAIAVGDILPPLLGSTLTPVVVFIPLAFLTGVAGVFFRALAITMVVALLASLVLAITLTPCMASWALRRNRTTASHRAPGLAMLSVIAIYQFVVTIALRNRWFTVALCGIVLAAAAALYVKAKNDFLPHMDEGGFVIDYVAPPGTSLDESDRQLRQAEAILLKIPEIESYSRRLGAALGVALVEPNTGDFLVKLKPTRKRASTDVINDVRAQFQTALPRFQWEFPGILTDLIGDLTWSDEAIEVKILSTDQAFLKRKSAEVVKQLAFVNGVTDVLDGLIYTGPSIDLKVKPGEAQRFGMSAESIAAIVQIAMQGRVASSVLESDRVVNVRIVAPASATGTIDALRSLPIHTPEGPTVPLEQLVDVQNLPGELELHRDDLRQENAVTANLEGRDLGSAMDDIRQRLSKDPELPPGTIEYGGLYEQQQESFRQLAIMLGAAVVLVFLVALIEFGSLLEPIAIVSGAVTSLFGIMLALFITGTSLNVITFLGAIIGMGIVHKNGLLMLDSVEHLRASGLSLHDALVQAGRRRLRPVLMTSLAAALGMLPLAWGVGSADMLRPLALAVIGAVCVSVLLSLVATPTVYYLIKGDRR